jgi:hypothetical protein
VNEKFNENGHYNPLKDYKLKDKFDTNLPIYGYKKEVLK